METIQKLQILAEAAQYDSCGIPGKTIFSKAAKHREQWGIYPSFKSNGIPCNLLKILMTNVCVYDCKYCANRKSNDVPRAIFTPEELAKLFMGFIYKRYVEGLFLSSGIVQNPDYTMQQLIKTVYLIRIKYKFKGYIHLKAIPGASKHLLEIGAKLASRMSVNIEAPTEKNLSEITPSKKLQDLLTPMNEIATMIKLKNIGNDPSKKILPGGQTTQLIIGATEDRDDEILRTTNWLYDKMQLRRVYYSAFRPVANTPLAERSPASLVREHRLYQADFLIQKYSFRSNELIFDEQGKMDLTLDPKLAWSLKNTAQFPIELNKASKTDLLRIPGLGPTAAKRILERRRLGLLNNFLDLKGSGIILKRAINYMTVNGRYWGTGVPTYFSRAEQLALSL